MMPITNVRSPSTSDRPPRSGIVNRRRGYTAGTLSGQKANVKGSGYMTTPTAWVGVVVLVSPPAILV